MRLPILLWVSLVYVLIGSFSPAFSDSKPPQKPTRSKNLDFEGDLIEGVNKRPLDSLNQVSEANRRKKRPHLYNKKTDYQTENSQKLKEMRYAQ
jgi:hypothetical protein